MRPIERTNDFVVKFANVNGSGSASANGLFAKADDRCRTKHMGTYQPMAAD